MGRAVMVDRDQLMKVIGEAFVAGCEQGTSETIAYEWGRRADQTRDQAIEDLVAFWNKPSAIQELIAKMEER